MNEDIIRALAQLNATLRVVQARIDGLEARMNAASRILYILAGVAVGSGAMQLQQLLQIVR